MVMGIRSLLQSFPKRRGQAQGRLARLDRRLAGEEAGAACDRRARQQARPHRLGDDEKRRMLSHGDLRQSVNKTLFAATLKWRFSRLQLGKRDKSVMNDNGRHRRPGKPDQSCELKARILDVAPGVRRQSFWDKRRLRIREALARPICYFRRLADDGSSGDWRLSVV